MAVDTLMLYAGVYESVGDAEADYQLVKDLHVEAGLIDAYDAAVIDRREDGKVKSSKSTRRPPGLGASSVLVLDWPRVWSWRFFRLPLLAVDCWRPRRAAVRSSGQLPVTQRPA